LNARKSVGGFGDTSVAVFESTTGARLPRGVRGNVVEIKGSGLFTNSLPPTLKLKLPASQS
jgi:hypothetical protein